MFTCPCVLGGLMLESLLIDHNTLFAQKAQHYPGFQEEGNKMVQVLPSEVH